MTNRLLTIGWLTCLVTALWIAALTPQAKGYELSLTDAYPPIFWALTSAASILSASILIILAARDKESPWWVSGLVGIIVTNTFVLSLPLYRGYPINDRADVMNHIGYARDILVTGTISKLDFYPAQHLLQVAIELVCGATSGQAIVIANLVFTLLWTLGPTLVVGGLTRNARAAYLGAAFSSVFALLSYNASTLPSTLAVMLIPVLLVLHLRRPGAGGDRVAIVVSEILLALLIVYFHPATTLYLVSMLIAFEVTSRAYDVLQRRLRSDRYSAVVLPETTGLIAILMIAFLHWYISFAPVTRGFLEALRWLMGQQERESAFGEAMSQVQTARLPIADLFRILANQFGVSILVVGFSCAFVVILIMGAWRSRRLPPRIHLVFVGGFCAAIVIASMTFLTSSAERHPIRLLRMLVSMSMLVLPWWCWEALFHSKYSIHWPSMHPFQRRITQVAASGVLFAMIVLGQINVYESPQNGLPNPQVTNSELSGMTWLILNRSDSFVQASILPEYVPRFQAFYYGFFGQQRVLGEDWWKQDVWLPSHFYSAEWKCMADVSPGETAYLALSDAGRIAPLRFPPSVRQFAHLYAQEDWIKLGDDTSVSKLYDNGGFEVWMTNRETRACE